MENILEACKEKFPREIRVINFLNKNTLEVSYSCMGNVGSVLPARNRNIWYPKRSAFGCDCRSWTGCLLDNKCLTPNINCQAEVQNETNDKMKQLLRSNSEITRKNSLIRSIDYESTLEILEFILNSIERVKPGFFLSSMCIFCESNGTKS